MLQVWPLTSETAAATARTALPTFTSYQLFAGWYLEVLIQISTEIKVKYNTTMGHSSWNKEENNSVSALKITFNISNKIYPKLWQKINTKGLAGRASNEENGN